MAVFETHLKEIPGMAKNMVKGTALTAALFGAVDVAFSDNKQKALAESGGMLAGSVAGTAIGTALGGAIGSIVPVIGTAVGASVGGMLGGMAGGALGSSAGEHVYDNATGAAPAAAAAEPVVIDPSEWEKKYLESRRQYEENYGLSEAQIAEKEHQKSVEADRRRGRSQADILGSENQQAWNWATRSGPVAVDAAGNIEDSQNYGVVDTRTNEQWLADQREASRRLDEKLAREREERRNRELAGATPYENGFMAFSALDEEAEKQRANWEMSKQSLDAFKEGLNELNDAALMSSQGVTDASAEMVGSLQENMPIAVESLDSAKDGIQGVGTEAGTAGTAISESFNQSAADTEAAWEPIPPFFLDDIYAPIKGDANDCGSEAANGINSGIPSIKSAWGELTKWLSEKFEWLSSKAHALATEAGLISAGSDGPEGHAIGTSFFHGGWTEINEHGGEIIDLPKGSRIYPHATTMAMLKSEMHDGIRDKAETPEPFRAVPQTIEPAFNVAASELEKIVLEPLVLNNIEYVGMDAAPANINQDLRSYTTTEMVGQETGPALLEPIINVLFPESKEPVFQPVIYSEPIPDIILPGHEPDILQPIVDNVLDVVFPEHEPDIFQPLFESILDVGFPEWKPEASQPVFEPVFDIVLPEHDPDVFSPEIFNSTEPLSIDGLQPAVAEGEVEKMPLADTFMGMISSMGAGFAPAVSNFSRIIGDFIGDYDGRPEDKTVGKPSSDGNISINISGNEFVVREEADIDRIAHELFQLISRSYGNYQWTGA